MSPDDQRQDQTKGRDQRLRVDATKVDVARLRLSAVDRMVFGTERRHAADAHDTLIRQVVSGLFDHG